MGVRLLPWWRWAGSPPRVLLFLSAVFPSPEVSAVLLSKNPRENSLLLPVLWAEGKREAVLDYVAQDVRTTTALATECEACGALRWITKSGRLRSMALPGGWRTVEEAEKLREPYTSWMTDPWVRGDFTAWLR